MAGNPGNQNAAIEILDDDADDDVSVLTPKMQDKLVALLVKARRQIHASTSSRVAPGLVSLLEAALQRLLPRHGPSADCPHQQCCQWSHWYSHCWGGSQQAKWQIGPTRAPPVSTRRGTSNKPSGQCSGKILSGKDRISNIVQLLGMQC
jgi:hypothetical protein